MSQHDMNIANQGFPAFRADLNAALEALVSSNSGATAPATTFANMPWYDTANNIFKIRNEDNDAWISIFTLNQSTDVITAIGSVTLADVVSLTGTQTLTNKTLTSPAINGQTVDKITDTQGGVFAPTSAVMRNRIINGDMRIDQRNAGASIAFGDVFPVDRWNCFENGSMAFTAQRSTTAPAGFTNSLLITTTTAASPAAASRSQLMQVIEGFNIADLGWGTANAKSITISFWVRSSLTGQFGGAVANYATTRSYPFSFTISAANTFEYKTITIAGDTTGTWNTENSGGINLTFDLGMGSDLLGTAGAWAGVNYRGATGDVKLSETSGATFYITGVQLEKGTQATSFEYRQYQQELALCHRYFTVQNTDTASTAFAMGQSISSSQSRFTFPLPVKMRAVPTGAYTGTLTIGDGAASGNVTSISAAWNNTMNAFLQFDHGSISQYRALILYSGSSTASLSFSAEL
jgi:hypothetical protein